MPSLPNAHTISAPSASPASTNTSVLDTISRTSRSPLGAQGGLDGDLVLSRRHGLCDDTVDSAGRQ